MSQRDWNTISAIATIGGAIVAWHGYSRDRRWSDAHKFFIGLSLAVAVGPHFQDLT